MFNVVKGENFGFKYINDSVIEKYHNKGFNDVPNNHDGIRPWIGPFVIDDINYYLPLSSQEKCEIEFKQDGKVLGGVNVKWMTPFSNGVIKEYDIDNKINEQKNIIKQNNKVEAFKAKDIRYLEAEKEKAAVAVKRLEFEKEYIKNDANLDELCDLALKHRNESANYYNKIESFYKDFIIKELTQTINNSSVEKINELKNENEELKNENKELKRKNEDLGKEIDEQKAINAGNMRAANKNARKLLENHKRVETQVEELQAKVAELQAQVKKLQEEKEKLLTKVAEHQEEKEELRSKLDVVNTALVRVQHERNTAYKKLEGLQSALKPANKKEEDTNNWLLNCFTDLFGEKIRRYCSMLNGTNKQKGFEDIAKTFFENKNSHTLTEENLIEMYKKMDLQIEKTLQNMSQENNILRKRLSTLAQIQNHGQNQVQPITNGFGHATTPLPRMNKKFNLDPQKLNNHTIIGDFKKNDPQKIPETKKSVIKNTPKSEDGYQPDTSNNGSPSKTLTRLGETVQGSSTLETNTNGKKENNNNNLKGKKPR